MTDQKSNVVDTSAIFEYLIALQNTTNMLQTFFRVLLLTLWVVPALAQVNFTQSNLPIVVINTMGQEIPDNIKMDAHMGIIWNGPGQTNYVNGAYNHYDGRIGIERRGSTSQDLSDKKPYSLELRDEAGEDLEASLLGMPEESDWVLLAPFSDKSLMRDVLTYYLAARMMPWAPRTHYCEVMLNGQYQGVYALVEKIKRDGDRVDISKLNADEISGDDLTGGYIFKIDKSAGGGAVDGFQSLYPPEQGAWQSIFYQFHYPKPEDIAPEQRTYLIQWVDNFETRMSQQDYADPDDGYSQLIDVNTFVDYLIMNELTRNVDGYRLSSYLYKDKDSVDPRLKAGPVWDYNIALGNANYCEGNSTVGWAHEFNFICGGDYWLIPFWWRRLWKDLYFRQQARDRWVSLRSGLLSTPNVMQVIDSFSTTLSGAQMRNFQRWPILNTYIWPNAYVGATYPQEVTYLKNWLTDRMNWLDSAFEGVTDTSSHPVRPISEVLTFPNPSQGPVTFQYYGSIHEDIEFQFFTIQGQLIGKAALNVDASGWHEYVWEAGHLPPGVYPYVLFRDGKARAAGMVERR